MLHFVGHPTTTAWFTKWPFLWRGIGFLSCGVRGLKFAFLIRDTCCSCLRKWCRTRGKQWWPLASRISPVHITGWHRNNAKQTEPLLNRARFCLSMFEKSYNKTSVLTEALNGEKREEKIIFQHNECFSHDSNHHPFSYSGPALFEQIDENKWQLTIAVQTAIHLVPAIPADDLGIISSLFTEIK